MTNLERELQSLKDSTVEMMKLVLHQMEKASKAFLTMDENLALEVISGEKRVNAMELSIDKQCENIFALFNPVASDLRFVIAMLKVNSDVERIGDYADSLSDYVIELKQNINPDLLQKIRIEEMMRIAYHMMDVVIVAFETNNKELPRTVFAKDHELNEINKVSAQIIAAAVENNTQLLKEGMYLFSSVKKMERMGDHIKNIAEDWIFYLEGEVLKHKNSVEDPD